MLKVTITTPSGIAFDGQAEEVVVPTTTGEIGVRTGHLPLITLLKKGTAKIKLGSFTQEFKVKPGFVEVGPELVAIITHGVE